MTRLLPFLLSVLLCGCKEAAGTVSSSTTNAAAASPSASAPRAAPAPVAPVRRAAECLCDEHGLPMMAQITRQGIRSGADELPLFVPFYYVFDKDPEQGEPRFYTLGTTKFRDSVCAKVPADAVAMWSTVVGAYPTGRVNVYASFEQVERLARGEAGGEPIAVSPASSQRRPFLWPIAETRRFSVGGVEQAAWRIHFLGRAPGGLADAAVTAPPPGAYSAAEVEQFQQDLRGLDVVWVVDATGSMDAFWLAARKLVLGMTTRLANGRGKQAPDVRFGLVAFRDHDEGSGFVQRSTPFADEPSFAKALGEVHVDRGGDTAEAGLDAMDAALELSWRKSQLTTRVMVLVSDASFHEGAGANPRRLSRDGVIERANALGVHIYGLAVGQQAKDADRLRQAEQYRDLAARTGGAAFAIEDADAAAQHMESLLQHKASHIQQRSRVLESVAAGVASAAEISKRTAIPAEDVTECLVFLEGAIDLKRLQPGQPAFATGWVLPTYKGERLLDMRVLMSRGDCELLLSACRLLIADLTDSTDLRGLIGAGVGARSGRGLDQLVKDDKVDVATWLSARHRLVFRDDSVLRLSIAQLRHMSESDRRRRLDLVALAVKDLYAFERNDQNFFVLHGTHFGFLPEEVLP